MRKIRYETLPPVGDGNTAIESDVLHFFEVLFPYDFQDGYIPPLRVINGILSKGVLDRGMGGGCLWNPFAITESDYEEVISELKNSPDRIHEQLDVPEWIETYDEWFVLKQERLYGIPLLENMELHLDEQKWKKLQEISKDSGDEQSFLKYCEKLNEVSEKIAELFNRHISGE